ncbi:MAG: MBL fold metallo-hydrolase [Chloroflexi bacterium]|nr:MBL fold metallo-hydrolase [Chloroflexota bacterium]
MLQVTFHGAAETVTGSQHLIDMDGTQLLLDCGLFQGRRAESSKRNRLPPYDVQQLQAVLLSHAHTDHSANLPTLARLGFTGRVHCTPATQDLAALMLRDSAKIQVSDTEFVNKIRRRRHEPPVEPLYLPEHAEAALRLFKGHAYTEKFSVLPHVAATFQDAGHILGSASIVCELDTARGLRTIGFSGDLGRNDMPILCDPVELDTDLDLLIMEGTYGNRQHATPADAVEALAVAVRSVCASGGRLIIPAFAVGRAQELIYWLHRLMEAGRVPRIPVFLDSPLASGASKVFGDHSAVFDEETLAFIGIHPQGALRFKELTYVASADESRALNERSGPYIVISASGMCEAGRILHHLRNNIGDPRNLILIVSWQAEHTLGRRLVERQPRVRIFGEEFAVRAPVQVINGLSAHADQAGLLRWAGALRGRVKQVALVHGELDALQALRAQMLAAGFPNVHIPKMHETLQIP